ncbi:MAG: ATP-binding protein [Ignavibacteriae bacterium]|nr:ATP-binding protein [Ignavibacteriota bacterium]MCB9242395.1 ATP-binding protein [Ignavibacteriales bacterium]
MKTLYIELDSQRSEIAKFEEVLARVNEETMFEIERFINLQIAVSEALVNAIVHGNKENPSKKVHVIINYDKDMIEVKVKDEGDGFDISMLPDPTNEENLLKESGRGVYIIMSLVDEFSFDSNDSGTEMSLVIRKEKNSTPQ